MKVSMYIMRNPVYIIIVVFVFDFICPHISCHYSYTEDVTPEELSKILASFDPKIASLERKVASSGPVGIVSAKAKKAAAGDGKGM